MTTKLTPMSEANQARVKAITDKLPRGKASPEEVEAVERARASIADGTAVLLTTEEMLAKRAATTAKLGERALFEPEAFWRSLTPTQIRALLQAAPKPVGEWLRLPGPREVWRRYDDGNGPQAVVSNTVREPARFRWCIGHNESFRDGEAASVAEAQAAADRALLAAGWLLESPAR